MHGQFRDLLLLFAHHGFPSHRGGDVETTSYVFNGDWLDRGAHQLEVVTLLLALKVLYPERVWLVRGNHECRSQSEGMGSDGFQAHVRARLGALADPARPMAQRDDPAHAVYEGVHQAFEWLPLAAVVAKKILVLHGGIGDGSWSIEDLNRVQRPVPEVGDPGVPPCAFQALWSDPSDSDADMARGVHPNPGRGPGVPRFGPDVTVAFCRRERIEMVVRSHQVVREGAKCMHGGHLVTLFSARNYCEGHTNDSALLLAALDDQGRLRVRTKRLEHRLGTGGPGVAFGVCPVVV